MRDRFSIPLQPSINANFSYADGIDFIGPEPSILTFTSGQSVGSVQCANVTVLDDNILSGQRNLSIRLTSYGEGSGVRINDTMLSVDITIDHDTDDSKRCYYKSHVYLRNKFLNRNHSGFLSVNIHSLRR